MTYSIDANGNDNSPEWGWCRTRGCEEPAEPFWFTGGYPDEADLLLCYKCVGRRMGELEAAIQQVVSITMEKHGTAYSKIGRIQELLRHAA